MKEKHGKTLYEPLKTDEKLTFDIDKHRRIARNYARKHYAVIKSLLLWDKKPENEAFSRINTKG